MRLTRKEVEKKFFLRRLVSEKIVLMNYLKKREKNMVTSFISYYLLQKEVVVFF